MRTPLSKLLIPVLAFATVAGCRCEEPQPVRQLGQLTVLYPDPVDANVTLSSEVSENKATYDLGPVFMGQTATLPIKVQNAGAGALTLSTIQVIQGTDIVTVGELKAPNPVFDVKFVPETVVPEGEMVELTVSFQPEQLELTQKDYVVIFTLSAAGATDDRSSVEITLKGKGISGVCKIESPLDFGAVAKNDIGKQTVVIRNPTQLEATAFVGDVFGSDAPAFTFTSDSAKGNVTLPPNTTKNVHINFAPTEVRPYLAFVKMRASAACPEVTVKLQGSGVDAVLTWYWVKPDTTKDFSQVDFGYASPGIEVNRKVTFENLGKNAVELSSLKWNTGEFKVIGEPGAADPTKLTIPGAVNGAPGIKELPVMVKPSLLGPRTAQLTWTTNLSKQPNGTFRGKAFGGGPDIQTTPASTLAFGKVAYFPGATPASFTKRKIVVSNVGTAPVPADVAGNLHVQTPTVTDGSSCTTCLPGELAVNLTSYDSTKGLVAAVGQNTAYVELTVTPQQIGLKTWEVSIPSNDPDEPVVKITVTADVQILPPCNVTVQPGNLNFGLVSAPAYRDLTVNIKNTGTELCIINNLGLQAGSHNTFELPGGPIDSRDLNAGETLSVIVRAYPKSSSQSSLTPVTGKLEFFINSGTTPQKEVPLSATLAQGCLTITPPDIDFGTVERGCASGTRTVTIYNSCSTSVTVTGINVVDGAGFPQGQNGCTTTGGCPEFFKTSTIPSGGQALAPGGAPITFTTKYIPLDLGADQGTIAISANQNGSNVTYILPLTGRGDTIGQNTDVFSQDAKPKADILIAIDSSCSMGPYQTALSQNFQAFIQYAQAAGVDYNIAVITTECTGSPYCSTGPHSGRFVSGGAHPEKILTPNTADVENKFAAKVNVGTSGSATETCLAPMEKALSSPLITTDNAGFMRPDAKLALVCVTDAPDQSSQSALYYLSFFQSLKGTKAANALTFNAIAGFSSAPTCSYDSGPDNGKYAYLVTNTNGVKDDICTPNWATTLQQLGKTAFGFRTDFFLNAIPDLTGGKKIEVKIDGVVIPATDSRGATVWVYDSVSNSVNFEPSYVPEPGQTMTITYFVTCYAATP